MSTFYILTAYPVSANAVRVSFNAAPQVEHPRLANDGMNPLNYSITVLSGNTGWSCRPCYVKAGPWSTILEICLDESMPGPVMNVSTRLRITVSNVKSSTGLSLSGVAYVDFTALAGKTVDTATRLKASYGVDAANYQIPTSTNYGGSMAVGPSGDYVTMSGTDQIKKMILRQLVTRKGAFFHLPEFGADINPKELAAPYKILSAKNEVQRQTMKIPGVMKSSVDASIPTPGQVLFQVKVKTVQGQSFTLPYPVTVS